MRVEFTSLAELDLADALTYIAQHNVDAAIRVRDAILVTCDFLCGHPELAEKVPNSTVDLRRAIVKGYPNYIIFYRPIVDGIEIVRLGEGHRDWQSIMNTE